MTGSAHTWLVLVGLATISAGCTSLNPAPDINRSAMLVQEHSGWTPQWNAPWSQRIDSWDGQAPLTAEQAVTIALQNNRPIRAELEGIASARADLVQSGLLPNPVLNVSFDPILSGPAGSTAISVSLVQEFTALWLRPARKGAAAARLEEEVRSVSDKALRLVADVQQAHARLVFAQRAVTLTQQAVDLFSQSIDATRQRIAAGEAVELDVNRLQLRLLQQQTQLIQRQKELGQQKREMLELMGMAAASAEWTTTDTIPVMNAWQTDIAEDAIIAMARSQRLDVAASQFAVEALRQEVRIANLGRLPAVDAGPEYHQDEDGRKELGATADIQIPIFDTNRAQVAKSLSALRRAQIDADRIDQAAITQARSAWLTVQANSRLASTYRDQILELSRRTLELAEKSRKAGTADMTVLLEAQREQIDAKATLNELDRDMALGLIELQYAVGGRLPR